MKNLLIILSGPAGSGKTTLCENVLKKHSNFERVITVTTRSPRPNEVDGKDYIFMTNEAFEKALENGEFYEYAKVHGRYYGTLKSSIQNALKGDKSLFLVIDVQGAKAWEEIAKTDEVIRQALLSIFIMPESIEVLVERLVGRNSDDSAEIEKRMNTAKIEMTFAKDFNKIIDSKTREDDLASIEAIIEEAQG
ncbi:MAG: guanylate kinase [Opitutales bacterium]